MGQGRGGWLEAVWMDVASAVLPLLVFGSATGRTGAEAKLAGWTRSRGGWVGGATRAARRRPEAEEAGWRLCDAVDEESALLPHSNRPPRLIRCDWAERDKLAGWTRLELATSGVTGHSPGSC